jgi:hypothetical protein
MPKSHQGISHRHEQTPRSTHKFTKVLSQNAEAAAAMLGSLSQPQHRYGGDHDGYGAVEGQQIWGCGKTLCSRRWTASAVHARVAPAAMVCTRPHAPTSDAPISRPVYDCRRMGQRVSHNTVTPTMNVAPPVPVITSRALG